MTDETPTKRTLYECSTALAVVMVCACASHANLCVSAAAGLVPAAGSCDTGVALVLVRETPGKVTNSVRVGRNRGGPSGFPTASVVRESG